MKGLILIFLGAILFGLAACSATFPTATPTVPVIALPASSGSSAAAPVNGRGAGALAPQSAAANQQAAAASGQAATPTPTRILNAPLSAALSQPAASSTPTPATSLPSPPMAPTPAPQSPVATAQAAPAPAPVTATLPAGRFVIQLASGGDIITVNADGSGQKRLAAGIDPSWSRDGQQIAFASWTAPQGIYVMNADGSNQHLVYQINGAKNPVWSPDDSSIAFTWKYKSVQRTNRQGAGVGLPQDYWRVSVVDLTTGNKTDMPLDPDLHAFSADWGMNGQMAYKGMRGLFASDMVDTPVQTTKYPLDDTPVWSPDGTRIALATYRQDHWDIAVANADGSGYAEITSSPTTLGVKPVNNVAPRWSPDGKSIAFVSDRAGVWSIYVMNPDGSNQRKLLNIQITYDFASERVFSWTK